MKFYDFLMSMAKKVTKKIQFIEKCEVEEAPFLVTNHTVISAPAMFLIHYPRKIRTWSHYAFLDKETAVKHLKTNVLRRRKYGKLFYPFVKIFASVIVWFFRSANAIPVWRGSRKITQTLDESISTKMAGITQVIFPERLENGEVLANPCLYKLNRGFVYVAQNYYEKTGECLNFYPAYSCPDLATIVIGEPIRYNPDIPIVVQKESICRYLENKIYALAMSLPKHKIILPIG